MNLQQKFKKYKLQDFLSGKYKLELKIYKKKH